MNGGPSQSARVLAGVFADKLPPRNAEDEVTRAWIAVDWLTSLTPREVRENIQAIAEMREKLDVLFEGAFK